MRKKIFAVATTFALAMMLVATACVDSSAATKKIMVDGVVYDYVMPDGTTTSTQVTPAIDSQKLANVASEVANAGAAAAEQKAEEIATEQVEIGPPYYIEVDTSANIVRVWCNKDEQSGKWTTLVREMICSTGRAGHRTPTGTYKIYEHTDGGGAHLMVDGTYGRYCMRWKQGGYMFHSVCYSSAKAAEPIAQEVADLGTSVSRGCIRLSVEDAKWMYNNMANGTVVYIY